MGSRVPGSRRSATYRYRVGQSVGRRTEDAATEAMCVSPRMRCLGRRCRYQQLPSGRSPLHPFSFGCVSLTACSSCPTQSSTPFHANTNNTQVAINSQALPTHLCACHSLPVLACRTAGVAHHSNGGGNSAVGWAVLEWCAADAVQARLQGAQHTQQLFGCVGVVGGCWQVKVSRGVGGGSEGCLSGCVCMRLWGAQVWEMWVVEWRRRNADTRSDGVF